MAAELPPLYHLVPAQQWKDVEAAGTAYFPATYEADGFTHMTEDASVLLTVGAFPTPEPVRARKAHGCGAPRPRAANHFYTSIPGEFIVVRCERSGLTSEVKFEPAAPVGDQVCTTATHA